MSEKAENLGMKKFRDYQPDQLRLLSPNLNDWLPEGHLARFISEVVDDVLDLDAVLSSYDDDKGGQPPYHPAMMTKLLLYGYCTGVVSSRAIERATWEVIPFRYLSADQHPDHSALSVFRKRHLKALSELFKQVLNLAMKGGLVSLELVAVDGTRIEANASRGQTYSMESASEKEKKLEKLVQRILEEAEEADEEEDRKYGSKSLLDVTKVETRLEKLREFKEQMDKENEALEQAKREKDAGKKKRKKSEPESESSSDEPNPKSQTKEEKQKKIFRRNLTDYDSRLMRCPGSNWSQAYNSQAVVDSNCQVVVACDVTNDSTDKSQLVPMLVKSAENTGQKPKVAVADGGYFSDAQVSSKELKGIDLLVSPSLVDKLERQWRRGTKAFVPSDGMREKLRMPENKKLYRKRKITVEPVFGQIKAAMRFRRFSFRGLQSVQLEWVLVCTAHNLLKIFRNTWRPA